MRVAFGYTQVRSRGHFSFGEPSSEPYLQQQGIESPHRSIDGGGVAAHLALGGTPVPGLVLAAELTSHMFTSPELSIGGVSADNTYGYYGDDGGIKYTTLGGLVVYYPDDTAGFNAGLAFGTMSEYTRYYSYDGSGGSGVYLAPQLGYEVWAGDQWSVGALLRVSFARLTDSGESWGPDYELTSNVALPALFLTLTNH